ncbi:uncharacterized protein LOC119681583 [Teleopsis dalmanni]|uniref:uncharacterized protein LOC119681576 n=1 Tax=Teleopsis dalmanni TaxID=139649 RepID=UPI0018CD37A4|nr:uncharacterized protein LOC119681576 [Teleopsis dalmanni]XP_037950752.1 uncharacterized protein LOC119681583 [Teleopsis dalmanni]
MDSSSQVNTKKRSRNSWTEGGVQLFLELWAENLPQLRGPRRNGHIFKDMAKEMCEMGYMVTASEVQRKVHNFTQRFRKEQQCVGVLAGMSTNWKYFQILQRILGNSPIHNSIELVCESIADQVPSSNDASSPCSSADPIPNSELNDSKTPAEKRKKRKKKDVNENLLEQFQNLVEVEKRRIELQERTDERFLNLMKASNDTLSRIASIMERGFLYTRIAEHNNISND